MEEEREMLIYFYSGFQQPDAEFQIKEEGLIALYSVLVVFQEFEQLPPLLPAIDVMHLQELLLWRGQQKFV